MQIRGTWRDLGKNRHFAAFRMRRFSAAADIMPQQCAKIVRYFHAKRSEIGVLTHLFALTPQIPLPMLTEIHPKLPMRNKAATRDFYLHSLGFEDIGEADFEGYLLIRKDNVEIHFFEHKELNALENDGGVYIRTDDIDALYQFMQETGVSIHPAGHLQLKPWGQKEFAILDPDHNLLTFGQAM